MQCILIIFILSLNSSQTQPFSPAHTTLCLLFILLNPSNLHYLYSLKYVLFQWSVMTNQQLCPEIKTDVPSFRNHHCLS